MSTMPLEQKRAVLELVGYKFHDSTKTGPYSNAWSTPPYFGYSGVHETLEQCVLEAWRHYVNES